MLNYFILVNAGSLQECVAFVKCHFTTMMLFSVEKKNAVEAKLNKVYIVYILQERIV